MTGMANKARDNTEQIIAVSSSQSSIKFWTLPEKITFNKKPKIIPIRPVKVLDSAKTSDKCFAISVFLIDSDFFMKF